MRTLLLFLLLFITLPSLASNKICVGETVLVVFNEELKKLTVHDKETFAILQSNHLEGHSFGEIALSADESKIWFPIDNIMYARDLTSGEIVKEIHGISAYKFEFNAAMDYLIHVELMEDRTVMYAYDLNSTEAIAYANIPLMDLVETVHFDATKQQFHILFKQVQSKTETLSKEPLFGLPETIEQIALDFLHDGMESRYYVYDSAEKKEVFNQVLPYSPDYGCNFEVINERLFVVTALGTAEVMDDFSLKLIPMFTMNVSDYAIINDQIIGSTGSNLFMYSVDTEQQRDLYDDEVNQLLIEASGLAITETHYYFTKEGILYRIKRSEPLNIDLETSVE